MNRDQKVQRTIQSILYQIGCSDYTHYIHVMRLRWSFLQHPVLSVLGVQSNRLETGRIETAVGWACPKCTFINIPTRPGCQLCTTERPPDYTQPSRLDERTLPPGEQKRLQLEREADAAFRQASKLILFDSAIWNFGSFNFNFVWT